MSCSDHRLHASDSVSRRIETSIKLGRVVVVVDSGGHTRFAALASAVAAGCPEARAAQDEAEAMRRQLFERAAIGQAAEWLDRRAQLGRDVFPRGAVAALAVSQGRMGDITDLLRASLFALRFPEQGDAYQLRFIKLWRVPDAIWRITRMLATQPEGGTLASFLPEVDGVGSDKELRCRAAVASYFLGGLELARDRTLALQQDHASRDVRIPGASMSSSAGRFRKAATGSLFFRLAVD